MSEPVVAPAAWVREAARDVESHGFAQRDIDELIGHVPERAAGEALEVLRVLIDLAPQLMPVLVLPLRESYRLLTHPPRLGPMLDRRWTQVQVPGLILTAEWLWNQWDPVEQFQLPVGTDDERLRGLEIVYRTWRWMDERMQGWEYHRAFYIREQSAAPPAEA